MNKSDIIEVLDMCHESINELDEMIGLFSRSAYLSESHRCLAVKKICDFIDLVSERFKLTSELVHGVTKGDGAINMMEFYQTILDQRINQWNTLKNER